MEVVIAIVFSCIAVVSGSKCDKAVPLPKPASMEVLKKAADGVWYETVTSDDYISAQFICGTATSQHINSDFTRASISLTKYYSKASPRSFYFYYRIAEDGYLQQIKTNYREIAAHDFDQYGKLSTKALEEDFEVGLQPEEYSLIGDGTRYIAYVKCTSKGWAVWVYTRQKVLTTEDFLFIHNELVKHGVHTQLRLGKCANVTPK